MDWSLLLLILAGSVCSLSSLGLTIAFLNRKPWQVCVGVRRRHALGDRHHTPVPPPPLGKPLVEAVSNSVTRWDYKPALHIPEKLNLDLWVSS